MPVQQGQAARFEIVLERRRQVSDKLRGDEGHEARSIAALYNKEGVENPSTCRQCVIGFLLLISASAHQQFVVMLREHFEVSLKQGSGYTGGRNGCHARQSFPDLQAGVSASLFTEAADDSCEAGRTSSHKHVFSCRKILALFLSLSLSLTKTQVRGGVNKKIFKSSLPRQSH